MVQFDLNYFSLSVFILFKIFFYRSSSCLFSLMLIYPQSGWDKNDTLPMDLWCVQAYSITQSPPPSTSHTHIHVLRCERLVYCSPAEIRLGLFGMPVGAVQPFGRQTCSEWQCRWPSATAATWTSPGRTHTHTVPEVRHIKTRCLRPSQV